MQLFRRSVSRVASSSPSTSLLSKSRSINTSTTILLRQRAQGPITSSVFRRFASDDAHPEAADHEQSSVSSAVRSAQRSDYAFGSSQSSDTSRSGRRNFDMADVQPSAGVYVGNLLFDVTDADLRNEFGEFGPIKRAVIAQDPRGLSKGFGYVDFETVEQAKAAIEAKNQSVLAGRRIMVNYIAKPSRPERTNPPSKTLFIGNLAFEMSDVDLNKLFREVRNVVDVRVAIDRRTGQPRGFAHADFVDVDSAVKGMEQLQGKELYGRVLRIDYSLPSPNSNSNPRRRPE